MNKQVAGTVLMIRPVDFIYNEQTAVDNEFMSSNNAGETSEMIRQAALKEFDDAVVLLRSKGIEVIVFDKTAMTSDLNDLIMPDAVFPNNWLSTEPSGKVILYPMFAKNRSDEKHQFRFIAELLKGFRIEAIENFNHNSQILEGTGSLIIDRIKRRVYATISQRCQQEIFEEWAKVHGYEPVLFSSFSTSGTPVYHTNIIMGIGEHFAVVNKSSISGEDKQNLVVKLLSEDREVIEIDAKQTEKGLCGNILEVASADGSKRFVVMSDTAFNGYTEEQKAVMSKYAEIVHIAIPTIERIGGGSARCMLAEINLERKH